MRKFLLLGVFLPIVAFGQYYNCNPDPNGEPWITGDYPELTPEMETKLDAMLSRKCNQMRLNQLKMCNCLHLSIIHKKIHASNN